MKTILISMAIEAITIAGCNTGHTHFAEKQQNQRDTTPAIKQEKNISPSADTSHNPSIKAILDGYLKLKDALADDNGYDAARGANVIVTAIGNFNIATLSPAQQKTYGDLSDDIKEHAEHIARHGSDIKHQREHFDMLSTDIYDLIKSVGGGQLLYLDYCPMYNDGKGAIWISQVQEIKNPYMGRKMPTCGEIKERMK